MLPLYNLSLKTIIFQLNTIKLQSMTVKVILRSLIHEFNYSKFKFRNVLMSNIFSIKFF